MGRVKAGKIREPCQHKALKCVHNKRKKWKARVNVSERFAGNIAEERERKLKWQELTGDLVSNGDIRRKGQREHKQLDFLETTGNLNSQGN